MDHDEVLEQLELAALERGGIDRLMAGDTVPAAAVAGHIAGCDRCAGELERLRRAEPLLRDLVLTTPPADLRERTLAFVREHGVARGAALDVAPASGAVAAGTGHPPAVDAVPIAAVTAAPGSVAGARQAGLGRVLPWVAAIAAAVVISVAATTLIVDQRVQTQLAAQDETIDQLGFVTMATIGVTAQPDVERVALAPTDGSQSSGTIMFSPSTTELVVVATGLTEPPEGQEYRCWVAWGDSRESIGKMFFGGDLAYWVGDVAAVSSLPADASFGVSITEVGGSSIDAEPVIVGEL